MRRFLIDTDTGSDDAVALVMALRAPDVQVEAITVVAGNVPLEQGTQNALYTVEQCGASVPVYCGAPAPLMRPLNTAQGIHGNDGMGNIGLPLSGRVPAAGHAVDKIIEIVNRYPGEITLVTLAPLTNIALALLRDPSLAHKIPRCVVMGGCSDSYGNANPVAEYNIWTDPEAAQIVFQSGLQLTMVGWDISRKYAVILPEDADRFRAIGTPLANFCMSIQRQVEAYCRSIGMTGFDFPDPVAMAVALEPDIVTQTQHCYVTVETVSELARGQTIVDYQNMLRRPPNTHVTLAADHERFLNLLHRTMQ